LTQPIDFVERTGIKVVGIVEWSNQRNLL
jgi:hypothetical protein